MATVALGKTTNGSSTSTSTAARMEVSSATAASSGWLLDARARVWLTTAATVNTRFVIYSDSASVPATLLAQSDVKAVATGSEAELVYTFSGVDQQFQVVSGTKYWMGVAHNAVSTWNWSRANTASLIQQGVVTSGPTPPSSFGTPSALNGALDAYINYNEFLSMPQSGQRRRRMATVGATLFGDL